MKFDNHEYGASYKRFKLSLFTNIHEYHVGLEAYKIVNGLTRCNSLRLILTNRVLLYNLRNPRALAESVQLTNNLYFAPIPNIIRTWNSYHRELREVPIGQFKKLLKIPLSIQ